MKFNVMRMSTGGRPPKRIGTIEWTPESWDYKTTDSELSILLGEAKTTGTVVVFNSMEKDGTIFDFIEEEVDASSGRFISGLEILLENESENRAIWLIPEELEARL